MTSLAPPTRPPAGEASTLHNIGAWPDHWARLKPNALAVKDDERSLDWSDLARRAQALAGSLLAHGLGPGDRVALLLRNRTAFLEIVFGAARLGAISLPINLRLTPREIAIQIEDSRPKALFFEADLSATIRETLALTRHSPQMLVAVGGENDAYEAGLERATALGAAACVSPDDPAILMYTSGTTGTPKGALLPHRKALYNSLNALRSFGTQDNDRVLIAAPLFHSLGLQILALPLLYAGGGLVLQDRFDPERAWRAVREESITYFGGVPAMHQSLHDSLAPLPKSMCAFPSLRFVFSAGSAISSQLVHDFAALEIVVLQGYGQTETSTLCCLDAEHALSKASTVGRPVHHSELRIIRPDSASLNPDEWKDSATGEPGEIVVRGPITMVGYWERPDETAETLVQGWIRTGDLGQLDAEGFVTLVGRAREMLISGGENVYPAEIEAVYREHPAIRDIAVVGIPDDKWGEVGRAHIVLESGANPDATELERWAAARLASFKLPREIVVEKALPRTASGKIQKHRLMGDL